MGIVDPRGGADAWLKVVFGAQTRGAGRTDMEQAPEQEVLPEGAAVPAPCPKCGGRLRLMPGPELKTKVPTRLVGCAACGFVGLHTFPAPGPDRP